MEDIIVLAAVLLSKDSPLFLYAELTYLALK